MRLPDLGVGTPAPTGGPRLLGEVLSSGLADPAVCEAAGRVLIVSSRFTAWATGDGLTEAGAGELGRMSADVDAGWSAVHEAWRELARRQEASAADRRAITTAIGMSVRERIEAYRKADAEAGLDEARAALAGALTALAARHEALPHRASWDRG
ncbi:hypothetical protein [Catenuloplanes atrovinosus]|uniref:Uncharacterized protein n=1 Tax=Catenuloplanes atrovinosus TaxID=137266 RepID=A0AAE3YJJ3_9ACTN|nr:hypothetical protein [Catenuloplanes atrovinosus]MDR7273378.1 hypothetical protein [Catenuloplanes atrovinosus]